MTPSIRRGRAIGGDSSRSRRRSPAGPRAKRRRVSDLGWNASSARRGPSSAKASGSPGCGLTVSKSSDRAAAALAASSAPTPERVRAAVRDSPARISTVSRRAGAAERVGDGALAAPRWFAWLTGAGPPATSQATAAIAKVDASRAGPPIKLQTSVDGWSARSRPTRGSETIDAEAWHRYGAWLHAPVEVRFCDARRREFLAVVPGGESGRRAGGMGGGTIGGGIRARAKFPFRGRHDRRDDGRVRMGWRRRPRRRRTRPEPDPGLGAGHLGGNRPHFAAPAR